MVSEAAEIGQKLKSVTDYVRDCQGRVSKGELMDLQGLDKNVIALCDAVAELPEKEGQAFEKQMSQLIESLEDLANTIKEREGL